MTNGFGHPLTGEEFPHEVKGLLEDIAAKAAEARIPHGELDHLRSRLQSVSLATIAREFAWAGSSSFENLKTEGQVEFWKWLRGLYVDWRMANDDQFWSAMHQWVDEPVPPPLEAGYEYS